MATQATANQTGQDDPGVDPIQLANDRAASLVRNISGKALEELTKLRDHVDGVLRGLAQREQQIAADITDFAEYASHCIGVKVIMGDALEKLQQRAKPQAAPTLTLTRRPEQQ